MYMHYTHTHTHRYLTVLETSGKKTPIKRPPMRQPIPFPPEPQVETPKYGRNLLPGAKPWSNMAPSPRLQPLIMPALPSLPKKSPPLCEAMAISECRVRFVDFDTYVACVYGWLKDSGSRIASKLPGTKSLSNIYIFPLTVVTYQADLSDPWAQFKWQFGRAAIVYRNKRSNKKGWSLVPRNRYTFQGSDSDDSFLILDLDLVLIHLSFLKYSHEKKIKKKKEGNNHNKCHDYSQTK